MASNSDVGVFGINQDILDSFLLEETQGDEQDDERLNSVIRSLEAEINPDLMVEYNDLLSQVELVGESEMDLSAGGTETDMDFSWVELDMNRVVGLGSSPSEEEDMNWFLNQYGENMGEFGMMGMGEYSQFCYPPPPGEEQTNYCPLWQANSDDVL